MHLIQIVRSYLGLTQQELAKRVGITQADLCDMEIKPPYGRIDKYQRLSNYLGIPVHALVSDDCALVPSTRTVQKSAIKRHVGTRKGGGGGGTCV